MSYLRIAFVLYAVVTRAPGYCKTVSENNDEKSTVQGVLSKLDQSDAKILAGNSETPRKIVKRLIPEKNGEYKVYQGVTGQPGVDFPALTNIPATSFSCRGMKGGYYADLETNCQVFHICDNGRKISFLCPNGTIFQQSQLICDWWFKVDCSKSVELYEQSSEQLAEEERRRAESKKAKAAEYQRTLDKTNQQDYYFVQNLNYDGKQNGRINPHDERPQPNQIQNNRARVKSARQFEGNNLLNEESNGSKNKNLGRNRNGGNGRSQSIQNLNYRQSVNRYNEDYEEESDNKYTTSQDYYAGGTSKKAQNSYATGRIPSASRDEKGTQKRLKFKNSTKNNPTSPSTTVQKVTPTYTEATTFRVGNTNPVKESQQFAESAAFVSNRGNRYKENIANSHQFYYQLYNSNRNSNQRDSNRESASFVSEEQENYNAAPTQRNDFPTDSTFTFDDRQKTTTMFPYETTMQYTVTTLTPLCNTEFTESEATTTPSLTSDQPLTTGPFPSRDYTRDRYVDTNFYKNTDNDNAEVTATTTAEKYRQNVDKETVGERYTNFPTPLTTTSTFVDNNFGRSPDNTVAQDFDNQYNRHRSESRINNSPTTVSQSYRQQNFLSMTTEKPFRTTQVQRENEATEKDLSPYDTSFTYKQGKVIQSTLGPYVPFTRNYAYSPNNITTTLKPTAVYAATVPTPSLGSHPSIKSLIPKLKHSASSNKTKSYLSGREYALNMLNSLRGLENDMPNLKIDLPKVNEEQGSNASGPSTLHSLALYFSTATDNFDLNETTDSAISIEYQEDKESWSTPKKSNQTVEVPTNILTQHTIASYAELFKLNNALETENVTTDNHFDSGNVYDEDYSDDLDVQQSRGMLDGARMSNTTKLRELAQVFTHALSAYLLDPETFKKVLTEIRPTEPPQTTLNNDVWRTTPAYPIADEDYPSSVREKDEVLNFSDSSNELGRQKLTTVYPTTVPPASTLTETTYESLSTQPTNYYTAPTTQAKYDQNGNTYYETSSMQPIETTFVSQSDLATSTSSRFNDVSGQSNKINNASRIYQKFFPSDEVASTNRVGGFQNNTVDLVTGSYGKVRVFSTKSMNNDRVTSPIPSTNSQFVQAVPYNWNKKTTSKKPEQQLTPPFFDNYRDFKEQASSPAVPNVSRQKVRATTTSIPNESHDKVRYRKPSMPRQKANGESLVTARTSYMKFKNNYNVGVTEKSTFASNKATDPSITATNNYFTTPFVGKSSTAAHKQPEKKFQHNNHWTSSPEVTQLWETSVFVDPKRINNGLQAESIPATITTESSERMERGSTTPSLREEMFSTTSRESTRSFNDDDSDLLSPISWQKPSRNKDSPTAFTLLPTVFSLDHTATPKPVITTRSSITTTITSSVTSTNSEPQDNLVSSLLSLSTAMSKLNETENEVAERIFGKLNSTSTDTLMSVMKQADNNETVRQLVLLLISHCTEPANRTMEREKEQLLNVLLRMPVNEFTSDESKNVVAGISKLTVPTILVSSSPSTHAPRSTASTLPTFTEPSVTTYRNRKNRKFQTTTESSGNIVRRSEKLVKSPDDGNNSLSEDETSVSDNRALELLRSLYTIASKWG